MKKVVIFLLGLTFAMISQKARAQQYTYELGNDAQKTIQFSISRSELAIEGYDGNDLVIQNNEYEAPPERAKGLRPLYAGGQDNTGIGLSVEEDNGTLHVMQATASGGDFKVKVPNRVRLMIEEVNWGDGDISVSNHQGEIEILSKNGDISLNNITGPVIASSTSGNLDMVFSRLSAKNPTSISLVSGYIDVTLPAATKADLIMSSISGEIYTDLDLKLKGKSQKSDMMRLGGGHNVESTLNGGGVEVGLKSISGDIYVRKSQ